MVHGYHVIMGLYGFWLPNDPRGSWSEFVGAWELLRFGKATQRADRSALITPEEKELRAEAKKSLKYPPVQLTGQQALSIAQGFGRFFENNLAVWACSILPEHVHLVFARNWYDVEQTAKLLKGAATRQLRADGLDPMAAYGCRRGPWARGQWPVFLDSELAIENAIRYVKENPPREGKPEQHWPFVRPFGGLDKGGVVTYL